MADIVLALRPKWLELILDGKKSSEFRRVMPKDLLPGDKVYLYHGGALHGVAVVKETDYAYHCCHEEHEEDCACLALSYEKTGCIDWRAAYGYLCGGKRPGVIELDQVQRFAAPVKWRGAVVQNFVYYVRLDIGTEGPSSEDGREEQK